MAAASGIPVTLTMQNEDEKLCFHEASEAFNKNEISEDLYFRYLLVHFRGFRHSDSQESDWSGDEITNSIKRAATMKKYKAFSSEELDSCQQLFQSCMHGDLEQVKAGLETLESRKKTLLPPLAMIGFIKDHAEISHYCVLEAIELKVELGHVLDLVVQKRPVETLDFLLAHNWKNTQNSPKGWQDFLGAALRPSPNHVAIFEWLLDHGVKIPHDDYRSMAYSPPPQSILKRLIELNPKEILQGGMMQFAAGEGNVELVKFLLDNGSEVNRIPPSFEDIREPGPWTALYMAVQSYEQIPDSRPKALEAAKVLLDHGADVNLRGVPDYYTDEDATPLERAKLLDDPRMLELFKKYRADGERA
ncbi:hypothetical protein B0J14DRAFT_560977 [Halenospora varia]|nr:hypothetical protein B0J14DRAFT_560977 [Halenospora varia]